MVSRIRVVNLNKMPLYKLYLYRYSSKCSGKVHIFHRYLHFIKHLQNTQIVSPRLNRQRYYPTFESTMCICLKLFLRKSQAYDNICSSSKFYQRLSA